jgi:hypothetical protein
MIQYFHPFNRNLLTFFLLKASYRKVRNSAPPAIWFGRRFAFHRISCFRADDEGRSEAQFQMLILFRNRGYPAVVSSSVPVMDEGSSKRWRRMFLPPGKRDRIPL